MSLEWGSFHLAQPQEKQMVPYTGSILPIASINVCHLDPPRYKCMDGSQMLGKNTLFCDGHTWNGSVPFCPGAYQQHQSFEIGHEFNELHILHSSTLSPTAGSESGWCILLQVEARNSCSHNLYSTGLLLQPQTIHRMFSHLTVLCVPTRIVFY